MSLALFVYYISVSLGMWIGGAALLGRLPFFHRTPYWALFIFTAGLYSPLLSIAGFAGLFRIPCLAQIMGACAAGYFARLCYLHRARIIAAARGWLFTPGTRCYRFCIVIVGLGLLVAHIVARYCYFMGGVNNWPHDELRGLSFTSAFAANYLKPAFPLDLSEPISYGYYLYEYTAFLYAAVDGYSWPSIALLAGSIASICLFNFAYLKLVRKFIPNPKTPYVYFFALFAVTFLGLDIFQYTTQPPVYETEWWHSTEITTMATLWNYLYHYLASAGLFLTGILCLHDGLARRRRDLLVIAAGLLCCGPTYAAITGIFFLGVAALTTVMFLAWQYRRGTLQWLARQLHFIGPLALGLALIILLPQIFTFWGRQSYLHLRPAPVFWFGHEPLRGATLSQWKEFARLLFLELGPVLFIGLLAVPYCIWSVRKTSPFFCLLVLNMALLIFVSEFYIEAQTTDWYWRSGGFGIIILCPLSAAWLFNQWMPGRLWLRIPYWLAALALLAPCVFNFYSELNLRYRNCAAPPVFLANINRNIGLHTAAAYTSFDPNWIYFAGRVAIGPGNPAMKDLGVYSLPEDVLSQVFDWRGDTYTCGFTPYGSAIPGSVYARFLGHEPLSLEFVHCPPQ